LNHSVIVITFMLAQSDSIKRRALYYNIAIKRYSDNLTIKLLN
jgi:hypothetical protein